MGTPEAQILIAGMARSKVACMQKLRRLAPGIRKGATHEAEGGGTSSASGFVEAATATGPAIASSASIADFAFDASGQWHAARAVVRGCCHA